MVATFYLDTSVLGEVLLRQSDAAVAWFDDVTGDNGLVSSRLLKTELTRLARREDIPLRERDEVLDFIGLVPLDTSVLVLAEGIQRHLRTLDALHVGTMLRLGRDDLVVVTHDVRMSEVANDLGFDVLDPCA